MQLELSAEAVWLIKSKYLRLPGIPCILTISWGLKESQAHSVAIQSDLALMQYSRHRGTGSAIKHLGVTANSDRPRML